MLILGIYTGGHDSNVALFDNYTKLAAVQQERMVRKKGTGGQIPQHAIDECLATVGASIADVDVVTSARAKLPARFFTQLPTSKKIEASLRRIVGKEKYRWMDLEMLRLGRTDTETLFDGTSFLESLGCRSNVKLEFYNHHEAHALPCLFHTSWGGEDPALLYTADGGGDWVNYSHRVFRNNQIETLYGGDDAFHDSTAIDSVGIAYLYATEALGYIPNRHEGKLTGLAAWGDPIICDAIRKTFRVENSGQIKSIFSNYGEMRTSLSALFNGHKPEDVAASIQQFLEDTVLESVSNLLRRTNARRLGLSGGVHANVKLNQRLAEETPVDEVFVYPAMSDAGLAVGGVLRFLLKRDGIHSWLENRWLLDHLYFGRDFGDAIDRTLEKGRGIVRIDGNPASIAVEELISGRIVAIYTKAMEYGPRALGARSILASPSDAKINQTLNKRLSRTEFMPFAPVVSEADADDVFDISSINRYAANFMTITCATKNKWRSRIPAVIHVDGTARPQIITHHVNPLYYNILQTYKSKTGLPVLINTSLNAHEEPIINTPSECLKVLKERRIDGVVTNNGYYTHTDSDLRN